ncbi:MAG: hypothetical protein AB8F78_16745 [Saprospiraceae bacterium]
MGSWSTQRWLIIGLICSNAVLLVFLILGNPRFRKHGSPREMIIERLDFNATQVEGYQDMIVDHQAQVAILDTRINEIRLRLYSGLTVKSSDESMLLGQLAIAQTEAEKAKLDHFRAIKSICTPEQVPKFEALTEELGKIFSHAGPQKRG